MRIAFFAKSKRRTRTTRSIVAALERAGHTVLWLQERRLRRWLGEGAARWATVRRVERFRPDLVLVHANDVGMGTLARLAGRTPTALFTPDCWRTPLGGPSLELARQVDLVLTVARGQVPAFEAAGVKRAAYLAEACDPGVHAPVATVGPEWCCDVAFIGKANADTPAYAPRCDLVRAVHARFPTRVYGSGWEAIGISPAREDVGADDYPRVCRGAKIVLGRDWTVTCEWYFSNRTWFTLGCGGFLVTNHVPGLEDLFQNHRELVWYHSTEECLELIDHYLKRPDERARIAETGRAYVLAHRTHDHFARDLVDLVEGQPPAFPPRLVGSRVRGTRSDVSDA